MGKTELKINGNSQHLGMVNKQVGWFWMHYNYGIFGIFGV